ncbi:hypothetical protein [Streptomyces armeniacus]|uniref:hypothetical protein n=1 Tax=Streptomyces armeniacus TaxID=83291 RepID=UPI001FE9F1EA|nr:hypothetical protein [Streptomyces armeniacus]
MNAVAVLCGLAANTALPPGLVDRLIAFAVARAGGPAADATGATDAAADAAAADARAVAAELADRADLGHAQAVALAAAGDDTAVRLARAGRLTTADLDPATRPQAALALLDTGRGHPDRARLFAADPDAGRRAKLAACGGLPPDVVDTLAADPDVEVVAELALWTASPDTAARLAAHPHAEVRRAVAANESAPPAVLAALLTGDGLPPARRCLVCDRHPAPYTHPPSCPRPDCTLRPGATCDGTHQSTAHETLGHALANPATPAVTAAGFAGHPSTLLRWALASRTDLPPYAARRLAADPVPGVRADLAANPAADTALLHRLAADPHDDVRRALASNPRVPLDVLARVAASTKTGTTLLPRIAAASPREVEELAASPQPAVRMLAAVRRDLPAAVRDALAADPDAKVLAAVAPHPGLSAARLRALAVRHGARVAAGVAANPDAPPELLAELARHEPPARKALRSIARHPDATAAALLPCLADRRARPLAAAHPALPPPVIAELLGDTDPQVAEAAAANPSLARDTMAERVPRAGDAGTGTDAGAGR